MSMRYENRESTLNVLNVTIFTSWRYGNGLATDKTPFVSHKSDTFIWALEKQPNMTEEINEAQSQGLDYYE